MIPDAGARAARARDRRRPWASGGTFLGARKSFADQRQAVVAEIHVGLVDENRRRAKTAARHHFVSISLELILDRLLADASEELCGIDADPFADFGHNRVLRDVLILAPVD